MVTSLPCIAPPPERADVGHDGVDHDLGRFSATVRVLSVNRCNLPLFGPSTNRKQP